MLGTFKPWQVMFLAVGAPGMVIALVARLLPEPVRRAATAGPAAPAEQGAGDDSRAGLRAFIRQHALMLISFTLGVSFFSSVNNGIAGWLPTFFERTHGWSAARAGLVAGTFTMTIGVCGALFGGWWADRMRARGVRDADLVVFLTGSLAMGVSATLFPLMPSGWSAAVMLAVVNFPAAFPFGVTAAALNSVAPSHLRGQLSALFLMVTNLVGLALGPWAVAYLTESVFHDDQAIRYSLATVAAVGHGLALVCMVAARRPYRQALAAVSPDR